MFIPVSEIPSYLYLYTLYCYTFLDNFYKFNIFLIEAIFGIPISIVIKCDICEVTKIG